MLTNIPRVAFVYCNAAVAYGFWTLLHASTDFIKSTLSKSSSKFFMNIQQCTCLFSAFKLTSFELRWQFTQTSDLWRKSSLSCHSTKSCQKFNSHVGPKIVFFKVWFASFAEIVQWCRLWSSGLWQRVCVHRCFGESYCHYYHGLNIKVEVTASTTKACCKGGGHWDLSEGGEEWVRIDKKCAPSEANHMFRLRWFCAKIKNTTVWTVIDLKLYVVWWQTAETGTTPLDPSAAGTTLMRPHSEKRRVCLRLWSKCEGNPSILHGYTVQKANCRLDNSINNPRTDTTVYL